MTNQPSAPQLRVGVVGFGRRASLATLVDRTVAALDPVSVPTPDDLHTAPAPFFREGTSVQVRALEPHFAGSLARHQPGSRGPAPRATRVPPRPPSSPEPRLAPVGGAHPRTPRSTRMTFIGEEIARQPRTWLKAASTAAESADLLPRPGERVAVVGCGTSWFMAEAYAALREGRGLGETDHFAASEFPHDRTYDRLVAISRSGTTTEILELLERRRGRFPALALTADTSTPIVDAAEHVLDLSFADERSVVQTVFATTALTALRAGLGEPAEPLAQAAQTALRTPLPEEWLAADQITFLGRGWTHGIAREASLKMREATQSWTESYPSLEYRHGPIAIAAPGRLVWHFGPDEDGLRADVAATGAHFVDHPEDPQADLIRVQRLAEALAVRRGLDPDRPRALSRSVILDRPGS